MEASLFSIIGCRHLRQSTLNLTDDLFFLEEVNKNIFHYEKALKGIIIIFISSVINLLLLSVIST